MRFLEELRIRLVPDSLPSSHADVCRLQQAHDRRALWNRRLIYQCDPAGEMTLTGRFCTASVRWKFSTSFK